MNEYKFEDLKIGLTESFEVVVTQQMMNDFLNISGDNNPLHVDEEFAKKQGYDNKVVYGLLTTSFISKLVGVLLPGKYCLLQGIETKYLRPVYVGDTLTVTGTIDELHESVKRASVKVVIVNQDNKKILRGKVELGFLESNNYGK